MEVVLPAVRMPIYTELSDPLSRKQGQEFVTPNRW